jgi:hypothetical protein
MQRAQFGGAERPVTAALQSRPGIDLMAFCWSYGGDATATFDALFRSVSHPNDATWQAAAEQQVTDREARATAAAAAATEAEAQPEGTEPAQPERRRRVTPNLREN